MRASITIVSDIPLPAPGVEAERVLRRVALLAGHGGGTLVAPAGAAGPVTFPGVVHRVVDVPPGLSPDRRAAAVAEQVGPHLDALQPRIAHVFGVPSAVPAVLRGRGGMRTVVEPGATPSQRLRDEHPDTPAARLGDLVELEEKTLGHADAVIARSPIEAATLAQRGVPTDRIWTIRDALPAHETPATAAPELPQLVFVGDLAPWSGWDLLLDALARVKLPWRLTIVLPAESGGAPVVARARAARLEPRVHVVASEAEVAWRVAGAQVVVCPILPARSVIAGGVVPEAALWAMACGRPLVAADLPVVRAYVGAAARYFEPGNPGALATALRAVLGDADLRADLVERGSEMRGTLSGDESDRAVADLWSILTADGARGA